MGMKLKSGADLCGFQLTNFCVQGEASAPSDAALGRKYFHTNATDDVATGISLLNRERIYLGEGAWRATAYLDDIAGIQTKLDMILGDVDLDGVIENMNEVIKFLEDNKDTENLMTLLDDKLSKSKGGIMTGELCVQSDSTDTSAYIAFKRGTDAKAYLLYSGGDDFNFYSEGWGKKYTFIHSGNYSSYALPLSGGTIKGNIGALKILRANQYACAITFQNTKNGAVQDLGGLGFDDVGNATAFSADYSKSYTLIHSGNSTSYNAGGLAHSNGTIGAVVNSSGNVTIGASDLAGTNYKCWVDGTLRVSNGTYSNILEHDDNGGRITFWHGSYHAGTIEASKLILNAVTNGNVGIGTADPKVPLDVNGSVILGKSNSCNVYLRRNGVNYINAGYTDTEAPDASIALTTGGKGSSNIALSLSNTLVELYRNTTIRGDLHVTGNIISDKEVSAGGAGAEEGTSGSGSAEGVSEIFTPTSTSMAFDHNLGEDVIVQVYEKSGNVWNMVMVDTEITSATRVTLRFGKTETTQHKVVIMGV